MRSFLKILTLAYLSFTTALPETRHSIREEDYDKGDIISRDVCVVGGGSGGTYTATRLRQLGQSVVVIEKAPLMGGMTNTYTVPGSGLKIDYGVIVFHNISIVQNYFDHYKIPLTGVALNGGGTTYNVDFTTGNDVVGPPPDPTVAIAALAAYVAQLEKYPYLDTGYNLPDPVPEDLLIPFKDFVKKYDLAPMVPFSQLGGGYADIIEQPTLYTMKILGRDLARSVVEGFVTTAAHNNGALYEAATAELTAASSLLLSSTILSINRNNGKGFATIVVQTPTGRKLIKARKIVVAIPPRLSNFPGWDLDATEKGVFGTYTNEGYWTGLLSNTGLPEGTTINNVGANTLFNLPVFPGITSILPTAELGLFNVEYTSPHEMNDESVKAEILAALGRLKIPGVTTTPEKAVWKVFTSHTPFFEHVTEDQIRRGFYKRAMGLQGHKQTWYTGATWQAHDSSMIWNFTETILPAIVKG
ncbi:hypothetical protein GP486_000631 [Trichoglossum hirsutum]|uniref:Uncharacterized protein n=1 Tax=Trichoglossum hirsutum TaxID=265104 RepID=A0A9P8RTD3_9PEZI|nr:hypothetical protein GP486_000631 [Trichoglossum hirsutum]